MDIKNHPPYVRRGVQELMYVGDDADKVMLGGKISLGTLAIGGIVAFIVLRWMEKTGR